MCPTTLLAVRTVGSLSSGTPIAALSRSDHVLVSTSSVPYRLAEEVSVQSPSAPNARRKYCWWSETRAVRAKFSGSCSRTQSILVAVKTDPSGLPPIR